MCRTSSSADWTSASRDSALAMASGSGIFMAGKSYANPSVPSSVVSVLGRANSIPGEDRYSLVIRGHVNTAVWRRGSCSLSASGC
jgi:hypothetical protein